MKDIKFKYKSFLAISSGLLLISSFIGCGQKAQTNVKASVSILGNLISGNLSNIAGGVMFFGKNQVTGEYFSRKLEQNTEMILTNGRWDFAAIAWDVTAFEGVQRCAINFGILLKGGDAEINFNLNTITCNNTLFAPSSTRTANGAMKPLEIKNCSHANGLYDYDADSCKRGIFQGYKISFPEVFPNGGFNLEQNSIQSLCKPHVVNTAADLFTNVKLPIITFPGGPSITTVISGYDTSTCSGHREDFVFDRKPLMAGINQRAKFNERDDAKNILTLISNNCISPIASSLGTFAQEENISGEVQRLICTPAQFDYFIQSTAAGDSNKTYYLGQNINLTSTYTTSAFANMTFNGKFLGFGQTITNLNMSFAQGSARALFSSTQNAKIKNVTFNNAQMSIDVGASNMNSGILVGLIGNATEIRNVNFNDPIMTINCNTSCDGFGIIAGKASATTAANAAQISETNINNPIINLGTGAGDTGGMIGIVENNIYIRNNKLNNVIIKSIATQVIRPNIGGAIGSIASSAAALGSEIWGLYVNLKIDESINPIYVTTASGNIGGAIGSIGNNNINESRLNNIKVTGTIRNNQSGNIYIGGFAGYVGAHQNFENIITNVIIDTPNASFVGGIVGKYYTSTTTPSPVRNVRSFGSINCENNCGGAFGYLGGAMSAAIENSFSRSSIISDGDNIGGLIGSFYPSNPGSILRSFASGNITGDSVLSTNVGGLIGSFNGTSPHTLSDSFADGVVQGVNSSTGLLIGALPIPTLNFSNLLGLGSGPNSELIGQCTSACIPTNPNSPRIAIPNSFAHNFPIFKTQSAYMGNWDVTANSPNLSNSCGPIGSYYSVSVAGTQNINGYSSWAVGNIIFCTSAGNYIITGAQIGTHALHGTIDTASLGNIASYTGINGNTNWYGATNHPLLKWAYPLLVLGEQTLGTINDPFLLYNYSQWNAIGDNPNLMTANFKLASDIDFSGQIFVPVGSINESFKGSLLGNNKTIKNIIHTNTLGPIGIFRKLGVGSFGPAAQIEHWDRETSEDHKLYLENINFTQSSSSAAGILAGVVEDGPTDQFKAIRIRNVEIINSTINGNSNSGNLGGLVGDLNYQNGNTSINGIMSEVIIGNCPTAGKIGGIIGHINQITVPTTMMNFRNWKSTSDILCGSNGIGVGGVVGRADGMTMLSFEDILFEGTVTSSSDVGGLIGSFNAFAFSVGYSKGTVAGSGNNIGGAFGSSSNGLITGVYTTAMTNGNSSVGGFIGNTTSSSKIDNCYAFNNQTINNLFIGSNTGNGCLGGACNNYHVNGSVDQLFSNLASYKISFATILTPQTHLDSGSPWFFDGVSSPKIIPEIFPE